MRKSFKYDGLNNDSKVLLISAGVTSVAVGLVSIYHYLYNNNIKTKLLIIDNDISKSIITDLVSLQGIKLIGISIHWHPQITISLKICELIKLLPNFKDVPIVSGGITASYFSDDLINHKSIDYIIKGDGEIPFLNLFNSLQKKKQSLINIPNLIFKTSGQVLKTKKYFQIDDRLLTKLEIQSIKENFLFNKTRRVLSPGRGCKKTCLYCGGAKNAYHIWGNKSKPFERGKEELSKSIRTIIETSKTSVYLLNDYDGKCELISDILSKYDLSTLKNLTIGANGLPSINNIEKIFSNTISKKELKFIIEISPESGSDFVRKKIKASTFTNNDLESFLDRFLSSFQDDTIILYFSYFLPYEDVKYSFTRKYVSHLHFKYYEYILKQKLILNIYPLSTDPGSAIQQNKMKTLINDVENFSSYNRRLYAEKYPTGNFLKHFPIGIGREDADFLHHYYRFDGLLLRDYPIIYSNLYNCFDSFQEYDNYMKDCFFTFYNIYIKNFNEIVPFAEIFDEYKSSLLGFNFTGDIIDPSKKMLLIWFATIKSGLNQDIRKKRSLFDNENKANSKNIFYNLQQKKTDLINSVIELLDLVILDISYIQSNQINNMVYSKSLLKCNHNKIKLLKEQKLENISIYPVLNNFCFIKEIKLSCVKYKPLNHYKNILLLGNDYFRELLKNIKPTPLVAEYFEELKEYLGLQNIEELFSKSDFYLNTVSKKKDHVLCEVISNFIILAYVPVNSILSILNIPHTGVIIDKNYKLDNIDIKQFSISKFYSKLSEKVDIRLLNFYLNYIKYVYKLESTIDNHNIYYITKYFSFNIENGSFILRGELNLIQKRLLQLSDGNNSISDMYIILKNEFDIKDNYIKDMLIYFYNIQIIY